MELEILIKRLMSAQRQGGGREEIEKTIQKDAPELNGFLSYLPHKRVEVYAFLALILAALTYLRNNPACKPTEAIDVVTTASASPDAGAPPNRKQRRTQQSRARHK